MALSSPQLQRVLLNHYRGCYNNYECNHKSTKNTLTIKGRGGGGGGGGGGGCCSAIAIDAPSSLTGVSSMRWGSALVQGARDEMEDDLIIVDQSEDLAGFSYAAVFDGHAGFSSAKFLRNELYKECVAALQGGLLLKGKELDTVKKALEEAFESADVKLLNWLETSSEEVDSGSTATVILVGDDKLFISHVGDSSVVLSQSGKAEVLTNSHRPYGSNQASLQEIRRIREAGGWIVNGRVCGDIAVSRAFGDIRFKNKKNEMLEKGVKEGRWSQKFVSRIEFRGDLVTAYPDVLQVVLGSNAECVILASDGLWDYINSSDAVAFVRNQLRQHGDVQRACEALAQMALDRGSQDNISIVVADLGRTDWASVPLQQQNFVYELAQALVTMGVVSFGIWMTSQL